MVFGLLSFLFFYVWSFILFFVFFELSSVPVILMSLVYGVQIEKFNSVYYLVFYSFLTGLPFLVFLLYLVRESYFYGLVYFDFKLSGFFNLIVFMCFLMKFPVYFLHFWLPKMHVEASTVASMLLAGLLLKFGVYGFYRVMGMLKFEYLGFFFTLAFLGVFMGMFMRIVQRDVKSQVAYSSICHMNFTLLSFLYMREVTLQRVMLSSLSHGFLRTLIFWLVGELYHYDGTRIVYFLGSNYNSRVYSVMFHGVSLFMSSSVPLSLGYFSEYGLFSLIEMYEFFYYFYLVYFVFDFYMSVYLFVLVYVGHGIKMRVNFLVGVILSFLLISCSFLSLV